MNNAVSPENADSVPSSAAALSSASPRQIAPPHYPLLRPEDEDEVERMFQRLKTVGHLERRDPDEK